MSTEVPPLRVITHAELRAAGRSRRWIERALTSGEIVRVRRGRFVHAGADPDEQRAAMLGGRTDCISLLASLGVFVLSRRALHVVVPHGASRLGVVPKSVVRHWRAPSDVRLRLVEALAQSCRCQTPRAAVATLDSAWHRGLIDEGDLAEVFALLPARYQVLRGLVDRRAESGPETLVRLMLRRLGCHYDLQVDVDGVGRVDIVVDGWLIIECDSREFHSAREAQRQDRRRDLAAATRGFMTLRLLAEDIMFHEESAFAALRGAIESGRAVHKSSRMRR